MAQTIRRWRMNMANDCYRIMEFTEANSQSFKAGDIVKFDSSEDLAIGATGDAAFLGLAMKDATNVTTGNATIPVQVFLPGAEVEANVYDAGSDHVLVKDNYNKVVNFYTASNIAYIDPTLSTAGVFVIIGPAGGQKGILGDTNPRVIARVLDTAMQGSGGAA
jgi:hypothetical protein